MNIDYKSKNGNKTKIKTSEVTDALFVKLNQKTAERNRKSIPFKIELIVLYMLQLRLMTIKTFEKGNKMFHKEYTIYYTM